MEELSIEEKAKAYDEALETVQEMLSSGVDAIRIKTLKLRLQSVFPELAESKDERVRKEIISFLKDFETDHYRSVNFNSWIAWLEKQVEQKSVDKVEPKFKVGDWYQCTKDFFGKGVTFDKDTAYYCAQEGCLLDGCHIAIVKDLYDNFKLWTIQDAKDGDVLMTTNIRYCPFIYRKNGYNNGLAYYYAGIDGNGNFCEGCLKRTLAHFGPVEDVSPATKEQRDLLFQKMKEAGYTFDFEKKELKKIEITSKESEDERIRKELIEHIKANKEADYVLFKKFSPDDVIAWSEYHSTYEQAVEAALKYCLTELI